MRSYFEHCLCVWCPVNNTDMTKFESLQRRTINVLNLQVQLIIPDLNISNAMIDRIRHLTECDIWPNSILNFLMMSVWGDSSKILNIAYTIQFKYCNVMISSPTIQIERGYFENARFEIINKKLFLSTRSTWTLLKNCANVGTKIFIELLTYLGVWSCRSQKWTIS